MSKKVSSLLVVGSLIVLLGAFQNCDVSENSDGDIVMRESLPQTFDKLDLSSELSGQTESSLVIDMTNSEVVFEQAFYNPSTQSMETCQESEAIGVDLRNQILSEYEQSSMCRSLVQADPEVVCTLELKPDTFFRVYKSSQLILNEKIGIHPCQSGEVNQFCEGSRGLKDLIESLKSSLQQKCSS